ncbi:hypothetical protein DQW77_03110 [Roseovarius sp. TE539]|uniref:hypothetical protein n=1 Tax=Roseovarius sp. TE539 TaxID=2249812 RepID=UPI000DDC7573|nr:hypothetical protein [Roseovarius sp. TE539]RBI76993.1 hypothetical protein DQW77_03110 [Roseovarius sp. TE539]
MPRNFIAIILAAAVAVTSLSAAPARAGSDDFARALAGVAAVAIIGSAIANNNRDGHVSRHYQHNYGHKRSYGYKKRAYGHKKRHYGHKRRHYGHKRHGYKRHGYRSGYRHHGYRGNGYYGRYNHAMRR